MKEGALSFLYPEKSLLEALKKILNCSESRLKKSGPPKKILERAIEARNCFDIPIDLLNYGEISPHYQGATVKIVFEDENFVAVNKPAGVHTHPLSYSEGDNLLSFFRENGRSDLLRVNQKNYDRGALYRLDYETSGLIVFAKSDSVYQEIRENFNTLFKRKIYLAVTSSEFDLTEREFDFSFRSIGQKGAKVVAELSGENRGVMNLDVLSHKEGRSLLKIDLKTGLRHQIRATLAALKKPILGDRPYGGDDYKRMMLHALEYELFFRGRTYQFKTEKPELF